MEPSYDEQGFLAKVQSKFAYGRSCSLTKYGGGIYLHINDNSKCWDKESKTYIKEKAKSISMKWTDGLTLRDSLQQLEPYARQIINEQNIDLPEAQASFLLDTPFEDSLQSKHCPDQPSANISLLQGTPRTASHSSGLPRGHPIQSSANINVLPGTSGSAPQNRTSTYPARYRPY